MVGLRHIARGALRDGCAFLERSAVIDAGAWWRDFDLFGVPSDEWVTGYTASALAETAQPSMVALAREAWSGLERRSAGRPAGFAYNERSTRDADSTVWCCRLARAIGGESSSASVRALSFLRECACPDGGIRTYLTAAELGESIGVPAGFKPDGWLQSHACVSAGAASLPELSTAAREYLRTTQDPTGKWQSYWWSDWEFATAYALDAMARAGDPRDADAIALALERLRSSEHSSPFALALRVFGLSRARSDCAPAVHRLLAAQFADGSWPPSARLRMPPPWIRDPSKCWYWDYNRQNFGCIRLDCSRIFGTATAVRALNAWLRA